MGGKSHVKYTTSTLMFGWVHVRQYSLTFVEVVIQTLCVDKGQGWDRLFHWKERTHMAPASTLPLCVFCAFYFQIFVGGLDQDVNDLDFRQYFAK